MLDKGLVKTVRFKDPKYVGDPLNAIKIFNDKEVDELFVFDIEASKKETDPDLDFIRVFASECFMPVCYGGGISNLGQIREICACGIEKVSLNSGILNNFNLIREAKETIGSQGVVVTVDVKKNVFGKYKIYDYRSNKTTKTDLISYITRAEEAGAGEILINNVDNDGTMQGYDIGLMKKVTDAVSIPVIACGGAGSLDDFKKVKALADVSAVAAGSFFVFYGKHKAVLITYPKYDEREGLFRAN